MKVNIRKTKMMVSGAEGEIVRSNVATGGICGKRVMSNEVLCTVSKKWIHARSAQTKKYPAVLHNSLSAEDVKILETARKNQWRSCVMRWRL